MEQINFNSNGPALSINIQYVSTAGQNINAVYTYRLWDAVSNAILDEQSGNNLNAQDDIYWLPTPSSSNNGRIIEVFSTLKNTDAGVTPARVEVEVCQGGKRIGIAKDLKNVSPNDIVFSQLFIQLNAQ